jgi:hypothetical protein
MEADLYFSPLRNLALTDAPESVSFCTRGLPGWGPAARDGEFSTDRQRMGRNTKAREFCLVTWVLVILPKTVGPIPPLSPVMLPLREITALYGTVISSTAGESQVPATFGGI